MDSLTIEKEFSGLAEQARNKKKMDEIKEMSEGLGGVRRFRLMIEGRIAEYCNQMGKSIRYVNDMVLYLGERYLYEFLGNKSRCSKIHFEIALKMSLAFSHDINDFALLMSLSGNDPLEPEVNNHRMYQFALLIIWEEKKPFSPAERIELLLKLVEEVR